MSTVTVHPNQPPIKWIPEFCPWGQSGQDLNFFHWPQSISRWRISGNIPLLHLYTAMASTGRTSPLDVHSYFHFVSEIMKTGLVYHFDFSVNSFTCFVWSHQAVRTMSVFVISNSCKCVAWQRKAVCLWHPAICKEQRVLYCLAVKQLIRRAAAPNNHAVSCLTPDDPLRGVPVESATETDFILTSEPNTYFPLR
jgi:hypothetical protein